MKALILSAGLGTRLLPYSAVTPKPMFTLAGRPLLDLHIRMLADMGCEAIAVNTHHRHEAIEKFVERQSYPIPVSLHHEPLLLGTGGAIKNLADFWDDRPFMVINADIFHDFDLASIYEFHCRHPHPVSLVLWNDAAFNSVAVDQQHRVIALPGQPSKQLEPNRRLLTFTGIQVLDPLALDFMPAGRPSHSIDAYCAMMAAGHTIMAYQPEAGSWKDLGTPERYREAARTMAAKSGFAAAVPDIEPAPIAFDPLAGDGSDRNWFRLRCGGHTLILCDHGLRKQEAPAEVDAFVSIGNHLTKRRLPVPRIHFHDRFAGMVVLEDLGDRHLQTAVRHCSDTEQVRRWYRRIIADLIKLSQDGIRGFQTAWAYQSENYDSDLILEKECRYFVDAFLNGHLNLSVGYDLLEPEFESLAVGALEHACIGFMHRDLQSRNIMVRGDKFYFIDFQAGRRGPVQYDLASLLLDPYVDLPQSLQAGLLEDATGLMVRRCGIDPDRFRHSYRYCTLARNLQILGAFGFLYRVKGKSRFEAYIRPAVRSLHRLLTRMPVSEFRVLREIVVKRVVPLFKD